MFTHADPFAWDVQGETPPPGYEIPAPPPEAVGSSTEDIRLFVRLTRVVAAAAFPADTNVIVPSASALDGNLRSLKPPFFDAAGNRLSGSGEHIVVLRPVFPGEARPDRPHLDAVLEVYGHDRDKRGWRFLHTRPLEHLSPSHSE